jgi:hypothetical protein
MSKTSVAAAPSTQFAARAVTLALALAVAVEASGLYALSQGPAGSQVIASDDAVNLAAAAPRHAASVEISIVAQADMPAR